MVNINVHFNPATDTIDMELTEKRMNLIEDKFKYHLCNNVEGYDSNGFGLCGWFAIVGYDAGRL